MNRKNSIKVGVEGIPLFGNLSGVGQYTKRLLESASNRSDDVDFEVIRQLMPHKQIKDRPIAPNEHLSYRVVRWFPPIIYYQLFKRLNWTPPYDLVALRKYNVVLFFNFVAFPVTKKTRSIIVIYDLSYALHSQYTSPENKAYLEKFVPKSIKSSSHIITISENSKNEIMEYYKVPEEKISIVSPAVDHEFFKPQSKVSVDYVTKRYKINKPYILSVCTLEPRKNLMGVLNAYEELPEKIKNTYSLVLVGGKGWLDGDLEKKFEDLSKKYDVIKTGYVPDADLPALYTGASVFVYPSFYEGFGIPALEAMSCGVPVITSDNSSLPEVVGDAGLKVKADDTSGLAKQVAKVLSDETLAKEMQKKGFEQSKKFNWDKSAEKLLKLIEGLAK